MAVGGKGVALLFSLGLLVACAPQGQLTSPGGPPSADQSSRSASSTAGRGPYQGDLYLTDDQATSDTDRSTGAAGRVVQCRTRVVGNVDSAAELHPGAPASSPKRALEVGLGEGFYHPVPDGLRAEREEDQRVLFTYRFEGSVKQAVIVHHGPTADRGGKVGWYVEGWARCDYAEFPDGMPVAGDGAVQIWTDQTGERQATYDISSSLGPGHCDWTSMTFLHLGDEAVYVRNPLPELQDDYFDEPYRTGIRLPSDAVDTGYRREGRWLWLSTDKRRAYVGSPADVESWPSTTQPLLCA